MKPEDHPEIAKYNDMIDGAVAATPAKACGVMWTMTVDVGNGIPDLVRQVPCSLPIGHDGLGHCLGEIGWTGNGPPPAMTGALADAWREAERTKVPPVVEAYSVPMPQPTSVVFVNPAESRGNPPA